MEVKDVRNLQKELADAIAEMVVSFEAETGCFIEDFVITREDFEPWDIDVDVVVEI